MINLLEDTGIGTREGMARHFLDMEETERRRKKSDLVHLLMKKMEDGWIEGNEVMLPLSSFGALLDRAFLSFQCINF